MHSSRRRAKSSYLGVRVCAPWKDSLFYSGVIEAVKSRPTGESTYTILFDDGYIAEVDEEDIIGPGFAGAANSVQLVTSQKVYITYNGREVPAKVLKHRPESKQVALRVSDHGEANMIFVNRDEIRLLKSPKHCGVSKFLEQMPANECPIPLKIKPVQSYDTASKAEENLTRSEEMAALVLTALSISPILKDHDKGFSEEAMFSFSPDSGTELAFSSYGYSPPNSPNDSSASPNSLEEEFKFLNQHSPSSPDEGIGIEFARKDGTRKRKNSTSSTGSRRTLYQCTWPGCGKTLSTAPGIIRHVRTIHLGPKRHSEDGYSDGEEEFYFTERDADADDFNFTDQFPHPLALSPTPTQSHFDMVKSPWSEPGLSPTVLEDNNPQNLHFNWDFQSSDHTPYIPPKSTTKPTSPTRTTQQAYHHKKGRGESKKCRKVYGMENRQLWCTQCRWKKACVRFTE